MPQFEYQIIEQGGGKIGYLNERIAQLVAQGFDCIGITGTSPHVSVLLRRPVQPAGTQTTTQASAAAAAPRPATPQPPSAPAGPRTGGGEPTR